MPFHCTHGRDSFLRALWSVRGGACRNCGRPLIQTTDRDMLLFDYQRAQQKLNEATAALNDYDKRREIQIRVPGGGDE